MKELILVSGGNKGLGKELFDIFSLKRPNSEIVNINRSGNGPFGSFDYSCKDMDFRAIVDYIEPFERILYINNAATVDPIKPVYKLSHREIEDSVYTNFINPLKMINTLLSSSEQVLIINITTGAAFTTNTELCMYSSTKAAMHRAIEILATEAVGSKSMAINFDPGRILTDMQSKLSVAKDFSLKDIVCKTPFVVAEEIFDVIDKMWVSHD
jgi:benzil reductase ((S)-benzoin forming)